jgi:hypothetical protein
MGWHFRRSIGFGPVRVNVGKRGIGYSIGGRGFRTGIRSDGRRYTSVGLPGTGLSYRTVSKKPMGCSLLLFGMMTGAVLLLGPILIVWWW